MPTDEKAPYYPWYPRNFMADEPVIAMTLEAEGAYRRLLDHQWLHGSVPADLGFMARICKSIPLLKMRALWPALAPCFPAVEGDESRRQNAKLERIREAMMANREKRSAVGKLGAEKRWHKDAGGNAEALPSDGISKSTAKAESKSKAKSEVVVDVATTTRAITAALNRGNQERSQGRATPVIAAAGTQVVADWLREGIPEGFAADVVYGIATAFKGEGQVSSLLYCDRAVRKAWARKQANADAVSAPANPTSSLLPVL